jgi:hypothetical protein
VGDFSSDIFKTNSLARFSNHYFSPGELFTSLGLAAPMNSAASGLLLTAVSSPQTITVGTPAPANAAYNTNFTVAATSDSGLAVEYSSAGACTNVGPDFTMTSGTGTCTVKYDQPGDANYNPAPQVIETVTATRLNQAALTLTGVPSSAAYNSSFTVTPGGGSSSAPRVVSLSLIQI